VEYPSGATTASSKVIHALEPLVVNRPASAIGARLKVVAFNAKGGGRMREIIECIRREPLRDADVFLLSEMDWRLKRSATRETAAELAEALGMSFAYQAEFLITRGAHAESSMGNAILSSRPLIDVRTTPLPNLFLGRRVRRLGGGPAGIAARIVVSGKPVVVSVAHLNSHWDPAGRESQIRQYLEYLPRGEPAVIGGDFNTTTIDLRTNALARRGMIRLIKEPRRLRYPQQWEPLFGRLAAAGFTHEHANVPGRPTFTFTRAVPPFMRPKLDWILVRGVRAVQGSAAVVPARLSIAGRRFSDHDFVVCEVRV
jgi:endonuclease/exonuclease/phosphatase family metal-dependent hydrolase